MLQFLIVYHQNTLQRGCVQSLTVEHCWPCSRLLGWRPIVSSRYIPTFLMHQAGSILSGNQGRPFTNHCVTRHLGLQHGTKQCACVCGECETPITALQHQSLFLSTWETRLCVCMCSEFAGSSICTQAVCRCPLKAGPDKMELVKRGTAVSFDGTAAVCNVTTMAMISFVLQLEWFIKSL